jgi:hypothetical protein
LGRSESSGGAGYKGKDSELHGAISVLKVMWKVDNKSCVFLSSLLGEFQLNPDPHALRWVQVCIGKIQHQNSTTTHIKGLFKIPYSLPSSSWSFA